MGRCEDCERDKDSSSGNWQLNIKRERKAEKYSLALQNSLMISVSGHQFRPVSSVEGGREYSTYFRGLPSKVTFRVYLLALMGGKSTSFGSRPGSFIH